MKTLFFVSGIDRDNHPVWDTVEAESPAAATEYAYAELDLDCVCTHRDSAYAAARCAFLEKELNDTTDKHEEVA